MNSTIMEKFLAGIGLFVGAIALFFIVAVIITFPVMWVWNSCLVGVIDGIHPLTDFWKTLGLIILIHFLFKGSNSLNKKD